MPAASSRGRGRRTISEINRVRFIHGMVVLLSSCRVTAPMVTPSMVDRPRVGKAAKQPDQVVQVVIQKDERLELVSNGKTDSASLGSVAASVKRLVGDGTNTAVVISADRTVKYETVVKVMDSLQRAGIARVGLSVQLAP